MTSLVPFFLFPFFFFSFSSSNGTIERGMKFYEKEWRAKEAEREREKERELDQYKRATVRKALFLRQ